MKRVFLTFLLCIIAFQFFQALFYQQDLFLRGYNKNYWKDRYEHSQYSMPLSKRLIGDDGLYAYAGNRVILGDNPITINVDKPPVGKYLIGFSILIFNSPAYYAFIVSVFTAIVFYFLSKKILKKTILAVIATTFLVLDPLFISQTATAWIDMPQLLFLLLNILFIWLGIEKKNRFFIILSGLALGLYVETKPPFMIIPVGIFESYILLNSMKSGNKITNLSLFYLACFLGIFPPYFKLFTLGYNLLDVVRYHKFMAVYNLISEVKVDHLTIWKALFFGRTTVVGGNETILVKEWNLMWSVCGIIALPYSLYVFLKEKNLYLKLIAASILFSFIFFTIILSYPRYLLTTLPFLYIFLVLFFAKFEKIIPKKLTVLAVVIIAIYGLLTSQNRLSPKLEDSLNNFTYSYSRMYFQDIYQELLSEDSKIGISREKFHITNLKSLSDIGVENITIKYTGLSKEADNEIKANAEFSYKTRYLGKFSEAKKLIFRQENRQWKLVWNWDYLLKDFHPGFVLSQNLIIGKRGSILDQDGKVLVADSDSLLISVNPALINRNDETNMLKTISRFSKVGELDMQNRYNENPLPNSYIPMSTLSYSYDDKSISKLKAPGIKLMPQISRIFFGGINYDSIKNTSYNECCSRIYSSTNYHGINGIEKKYDNVLSGNNGGELLMKDQWGNLIRKIKQIEAHNGRDIIVSL